MIVVDTSGLIAAMDPTQTHSEKCAHILNHSSALVTSPLVLAEVDSIVARKMGARQAVHAMSEILQSTLTLAQVDWPDVAAATDLAARYEDIGVGLTDASLVVLAKRFKTNEILTLDHRHFRAMRGLDGRHFKLLPFDLDD